MKDVCNIDYEETITKDEFIEYVGEIESELSKIEDMLNEIKGLEEIEESDIEDVISKLSDVIYAIK